MVRYAAIVSPRAREFKCGIKKCGLFVLERRGRRPYNARMLAEMVSQVAHVHVETCAIVFALVFCYALWGGGALVRCAGGALPAVPQYAYSLFPTKWDQLYTALFILFFAFISLPTLAETTEGNEPLTVAGGVVLILSQVLLYAPMLIRFAMLKPWYRPRYSVVQGILLVAGFLFLILLTAGVVNATGFTDWLINLTGCPEEQDVVQNIKDRSDPVQSATIAIAAVLQAPLCEECAFRGFLYNCLKQHCGKLSAALGSAVFFSAIHASLPQLVPLFIFGLVQCWAYEKAKSLWLPVCIHTAFNAYGVMVILHAPAS